MTSTRIPILIVAVAITVAATLMPDPAEAQRRRGAVVVGAYYRPVFYAPFFYDPWFPYGYGWYPPYAYGQFYDRSASLRLQVSPRETEIFIAGYYAGTVDNFDGFFQRLHLEPGEHEVTLYLAGYRTITQKILLEPGGTFRIRHTMEALPAGTPPEPRPVVPAGPPPAGAASAGPAPVRQAPRSAEGAFGSLAIRVQPADAEVLIDGERWEGPASDEALVVQLGPGRYRIEVRKDGYRSYTTMIDVRAGETAPINISLPRQ